MFVVCLSFHSGDAVQAKRLLEWIQKISNSCKAFECLLVADAGCPFDQAITIEELAGRIFKSATIISTERSISNWPHGCNLNWFTAMKWGAEKKVSILFLEPDCVVLKSTWLDELNAAYEQCDKQHMGAVEDCVMPMMPPQVLSGVAIYGPKAGTWPPICVRPWNTDFAALLIPDAADTKLIRDFFGTKELPPVFVESKTPTSPVHHFTLDWLPPEAVIFHRDKKHSLIPLLAKKLGIEWHDEAPAAPQRSKICVIFPVHGGDLPLALHHAMWLRKMGRRFDTHPALIAFDATAVPMVNQLKSFLEPLFQSVEMFQYPHFPGAYPHTANFAFQSVAHRMAQGDAPWFWCEPDLVVLKADWLSQLQAEYEKAQKSWMGAVVHQMGHLQGTSIYPADAAHRMPRAMACGAGQAFDMEMKEETLHDRHDCGHLLHHVWSILNDACCPVGGGQVPGPITAEQARRWLPREAVATHRWKTRHLIDLLLTGQYRHE